MDGPVVDAHWLAANAAEVRIADVRWYLDGRSGGAAYRTGHIPGAVWLDLDAALSDPPGPGTGRHPLPSPQRFATAMTLAGIGDETPVVAYDDAGGSIAARLWWLLHLLDHPVAVLDGGLASWTGPLEAGDPGGAGAPAAAAFTPRPFPPGRLASADQVASLAGGGEAVILDARTSARFAHGDPAIDPRPGHVPGAVSAPWAGNLDAAGRLRPADELAARYAALGVAPDREVVAYCGSGVTACHDLLALACIGARQLRLYPGSWSEWGADPDRPAVEGADG